MKNTNKLTYDPMLREAAKEIREILKKYDCAGYVALGSLTHFEFFIQPEATWSFARIEEVPGGKHAIRIRIKGKAEGRRQEMADATVGFLYNLRDNLATQFANIFKLCAALGKASEITHNPPEPSNDDREIEGRA